jgi:hypothetical protein
MSETVLSTPTPSVAGWLNEGFQGKLVYVRCGDDKAIPDFVQDGMMAASGVEWDVRRMQTSHSPSLSQPEELAGMIERVAREWVR